NNIDLVRQLSAQGWSIEAIAPVMRISVERVRHLLGNTIHGSHPEGGSESGKAPAAELGEVGNGSFQPQTVGAHKAPDAIGLATLERLAKQRAEQQAKSQALRNEIARLMDADTGPRHGLAKRIQGRL